MTLIEAMTYRGTDSGVQHFAAEIILPEVGSQFEYSFGTFAARYTHSRTHQRIDGTLVEKRTISRREKFGHDDEYRTTDLNSVIADICGRHIDISGFLSLITKAIDQSENR